MHSIKKLQLLVQELLEDRFTEASLCFFAGSYVRGEATAFSDLDIVVLYPRLESAFRESFLYKGIPIEAFHHDEGTLTYFMDDDIQRGRPSMPQMILEGIVLPTPNPESDSLKQYAKTVLASPSVLSKEEIKHQRYAITDIVDDLRAPRSIMEAIATGVQLYPILANFFLRSNGFWGSSGKWIPRALHQADPEYATQFQLAFDQLFQSGIVSVVIDLTQETLEPHGGLLFDGYKRDAPPTWRSNPTP